MQNQGGCAGFPQGYVTRKENEHFFVGSSTVLAGEDGVVRTLTFKEPCSD